MTTIPETQAAWVQIAKGQPKDVLKLAKDHPVDKPGKGELLIKVRAAGMNPVHYKMMGLMPGLMKKMPGVPESDLSGVVVDVSDSSRFKVGDEVFGWLPADLTFKTGRGALCQYAVVKDEHLCLKPASLSFEQAAGICLAGTTAHEGLTLKGGLKSGDRVFINGGGSSVGRFAIQIAKALGAYVVVSCSGHSADEVKKLGADEIVDYTVSPLAQQLSTAYPYHASPSVPSASKAFNVLFDTIGNQDLYNASANFTTPECKYVVIGVETPHSAVEGVKMLANWGQNLVRPAWAGGVKREWVFFLTTPDQKYLQDFKKWADEGKFTVSVDSVNKFDEDGVFAAYAKLQSGKAKGKVIIKVSDA